MFLERTYEFARGLGILDFYQRSQDCIVNTSKLNTRYSEAIDNFNDVSVSTYRAWLELTLTIGNTSTWYKSCYQNTEGSLMNFYYYVMAYESFQNYIIYFLPNLLSYAFVINTWLDRMNALELAGNTTGLYYYYGLIVRNLFFFEMPEAAGLLGNSVADNALLFASID